MNEYDLINAYLHLIYNNSTTFLHRVFDNYENFLVMKEWLHNRDIYLRFMEVVEKQNFSICKRAKSLSKLQSIFYEDFRSDLNIFRKAEKEKYQVLFLHGIDEENIINEYFTTQTYMQKYECVYVNIYGCNSKIPEKEFSFYGPYHYFLKALYQVDKWPGILVFKGDQWGFYPIKQVEEVDSVFVRIVNGTIFESQQAMYDESYFIQLSDLHLGTKNRAKGRIVLEESLDELCADLKSPYQIKFLITGDVMNSPNRKNMYEASSFMNALKKNYKSDVTFILGNHDIIVHGFNFLRRQKSKVIAYLLGESIKVLEKEKIILIKINSMVEGNLARGKVGQIQIQEIDEELEGIDNIEEYTLLAMLHHHVFEIPRDEFLKGKWHEKIFVGRIIENSKVLVDAQELIAWLKKHHIHYVFHGHKHLPFFNYHEDFYVVSGGSSCGGGAKESKSRYLSYNVLKYDHQSKQMKYCFIFYNDMTKQERQRIKVHFF